MKTIPYQCPYQHKTSCDKIYPDGYLAMTCVQCSHYDDGVRETGSFPLLQWLINLFTKNNTKS